MSHVELDRAWSLVHSGMPEEALSVLRALVGRELVGAELWFGIGQCFRSLERYDEAERALCRADADCPNNPSILLALGIAQQLGGRLDASVETLTAAITQEYWAVEAHNSLGITYRKLGRPAEALDAYECARMALGQLLACELPNSVDAPIVPLPSTPHNLWLMVASHAALYLSVRDGVGGYSFPESAQAAAQLGAEYQGLAWRDELESSGRTHRMFLPNYFQMLGQSLLTDHTYGMILGNRAVVLAELGRDVEAAESQAEAVQVSGLAALGHSSFQTRSLPAAATRLTREEVASIPIRFAGDKPRFDFGEP